MFHCYNFSFELIGIIAKKRMKSYYYYFALLPLLFSGCVTTMPNAQQVKLKAELQEMAKMDQIAAYIPQGVYKDLSKDQWDSFKDSVFTSHTQRLQQLFKQHGFLGYKEVGTDGSNLFWLMVQHADRYPDFQIKILRAMKRQVKKKNANPSNYAYLLDRVNVNAGKKQVFGTQLTYETETTGRAKPKIGLVNPDQVNRLRKEYGLKPLKDYLNEMTLMHFEMNKKHYSDLGLTQPSLYP